MQLAPLGLGRGEASAVEKPQHSSNEVGNLSDLGPVPESPPLNDIVAEARRLLVEADTASLSFRLLGGLAVALRVPPGVAPLLPRVCKDIDFIVPRGTSAREITELFVTAGYVADEQFNALNGHRRLMYHDEVNGRQCDIFIGSFAMCHEIPLGDRLIKEPDTIPLAELILTKLQVMELNDKDLRDILTLLYHHQLGDVDGAGTINVDRVAGLCAADWGLWRTVTLSIERASEGMSHLGITGADSAFLRDRLQVLRSRLDQEPKTRRWKVRARIGERIRWYEDVEEVG